MISLSERLAHLPSILRVGLSLPCLECSVVELLGPLIVDVVVYTGAIVSVGRGYLLLIDLDYAFKEQDLLLEGVPGIVIRGLSIIVILLVPLQDGLLCGELVCTVLCCFLRII